MHAFVFVFVMTLYRTDGGGNVLSSTEVEQTISLYVAWPLGVHFDQLQSVVSRFDKLNGDASAGRSLLV